MTKLPPLQDDISISTSDGGRVPGNRRRLAALLTPRALSPGRIRGTATGLDDGLVALTLAVGLALCLRFVDYAYDDAYITYRYARNLSLGHGFVYNLGQDFLGTTTPLYSLLLAGLSPLLPIPVSSGLISLASLLGAILASEVLGRRAGIRFAGPMAGLFLLTEPQIFLIFGGETLLVYFLLLPVGLAFQQSKHPRSAALIFGLAILGRMDAVIFVALVYLWDTTTNRRVPWIGGVLIGAVLIPWFAYSVFAFGQFFPSTLATKMAMGESGFWPLFLAGSQPYFSAMAPYRDHLAPPFLALLALGLFRVLRRERIWLFFVLNSLLFAIIYQWVLRSAFSHWYLASAYLVHALLLGAGVRETWTLILFLIKKLENPGRGSIEALLRAAFVLILGLWFLSSANHVRTLDTTPPRRQLYTELGRWLNQNTRTDESVAYFEIGYLGWYSRRSIIDPVGLVTPGGLEDIRRGHLGWIFDLHAPDYFVHNSLQGASPSLSSAAFRSRYRVIRRFRAEGYPGELILFQRS